MWATNDMSEGDDAVATPAVNVREGQLKNKQGQHINWNDK